MSFRHLNVFNSCYYIFFYRSFVIEYRGDGRMQLSQRVLALTAPVWMTHAQFVVADNEQALVQLKQWQQQASQNVCFMTGPLGSGRSHLAQALLREASLAGDTVAYVAAKDVFMFGGDVFQGLDQVRFVCIDDVDLLIDNPESVSALIEFLAHHRDVGGLCLMTCVELAAVLNVLSLAVINHSTVVIQPLQSVEQRREALLLRAKAMDVSLSNLVASEMMLHFGHDISELMHVLSYLAHASLTLKRAITLPFMRQVLMLPSHGTKKERKN
jgi:DnaA family protein